MFSNGGVQIKENKNNLNCCIGRTLVIKKYKNSREENKHGQEQKL